MSINIETIVALATGLAATIAHAFRAKSKEHVAPATGLAATLAHVFRAKSNEHIQPKVFSDRWIVITLLFGAAVITLIASIASNDQAWDIAGRACAMLLSLALEDLSLAYPLMRTINHHRIVRPVVYLLIVVIGGIGAWQWYETRVEWLGAMALAQHVTVGIMSSLHLGNIRSTLQDPFRDTDLNASRSMRYHLQILLVCSSFAALFSALTLAIYAIFPTTDFHLALQCGICQWLSFVPVLWQIIPVLWQIIQRSTRKAESVLLGTIDRASRDPEQASAPPITLVDSTESTNRSDQLETTAGGTSESLIRMDLTSVPELLQKTPSDAEEWHYYLISMTQFLLCKATIESLRTAYAITTRHIFRTSSADQNDCDGINFGYHLLAMTKACRCWLVERGIKLDDPPSVIFETLLPARESFTTAFSAQLEYISNAMQVNSSAAHNYGCGLERCYVDCTHDPRILAPILHYYLYRKFVKCPANVRQSLIEHCAVLACLRSPSQEIMQKVEEDWLRLLESLHTKSFQSLLDNTGSLHEAEKDVYLGSFLYSLLEHAEESDPLPRPRHTSDRYVMEQNFDILKAWILTGMPIATPDSRPQSLLSACHDCEVEPSTRDLDHWPETYGSMRIWLQNLLAESRPAAPPSTPTSGTPTIFDFGTNHTDSLSLTTSDSPGGGSVNEVAPGSRPSSSSSLTTFNFAGGSSVSEVAPESRPPSNSSLTETFGPAGSGSVDEVAPGSRPPSSSSSTSAESAALAKTMIRDMEFPEKNFSIFRTDAQMDRATETIHKLHQSKYTASPMIDLACSSRKVLDVGAGTGPWALDVISKSDAHVTCTEIFGNKQCMQKPVQFYIEDANNSNWGWPQRFDFINCRNLAGVIRDLEATGRVVYDSLRPGGFFCIEQLVFWEVLDSKDTHGVWETWWKALVVLEEIEGLTLGLCCSDEVLRDLQSIGFKAYCSHTFADLRQDSDLMEAVGEIMKGIVVRVQRLQPERFSAESVQSFIRYIVEELESVSKLKIIQVIVQKELTATEGSD